MSGADKSLTGDMMARETSIAAFKVGDRVWARTPDEHKSGVVVAVSAPAREMTGGRGVAVEFDDGTFGDGWCEFTLTKR